MRGIGALALAWHLLFSAGRCLASEEISVFAAASLTDALKDVGKLYDAASGNHVVFNFGASSDLARQIVAGAPADVFFAADSARMDEIERAGLVAHGERVDVLSNVLAVIVPKGSRASVAGPADLAGLGHVAVADPEAVPAGIYARTYLQSVGVWEKLRDKIVPTVDVRAALAAVEGEHADAGIVYRTDAVTSSRVRVAFEVPRERGPPIVYPLAPIAASKKKDTRALVRYLTGPEAVKVYERYGFLVVVGK